MSLTRPFSNESQSVREEPELAAYFPNAFKRMSEREMRVLMKRMTRLMIPIVHYPLLLWEV
jgi:hypothetical protein